MIVGDLAVANDDVMRQHAAHRFVEAAADGFLGHLEVGPGLGAAGVQFCQRLLDEVAARQRRRRPGSRCGRDRVRWRCSTSGIFHSNSTSGSDAVFGR